MLGFFLLGRYVKFFRDVKNKNKKFAFSEQYLPSDSVYKNETIDTGYRLMIHELRLVIYSSTPNYEKINVLMNQM